MNKIIIAPSILSADFAILGEEIKKVEKAGADWIHIDVMDGAFVPNITIGSVVVKSIRKTTSLVFDVHLMINEPIKYIDDFVKAGADYITVHSEACGSSLHDTLKLIKSRGVKAGVSIKPATSSQSLLPYIKELDLILIMTVEPGFGGQEFIMECLPKIEEVKKMLDSCNSSAIIQVDGGINEKTAQLVKEAGAVSLVAGSYIYNAKDISSAIRLLKD